MLKSVMSWDVDGNITEIYDQIDGNSSSKFRRPKLISFSINDRSGYSEQITKAVMIIKTIFDDAKIGDILSILFGWRMEYNLREKVREIERK